MSSEFYLDYFERKVPLTGLFLEHLGKSVSEAGEITAQEEMVKLVGDCLKQVGLLKDPTTSETLDVIADIESCYKKPGEENEINKPDSKGKFFAGYFAEWASEMKYDTLCLYVANFEYAKARNYFESQDQRSIIAIADEKLRLEFELARVSFEASLFGFGGSYKGTPKEGDQGFDLSTDGEVAEQALKNLGF